MKSRTALVALCLGLGLLLAIGTLVGTMAFPAATSPSRGADSISEGKSTECIERFRIAQADFCRVFSDDRKAKALGTEPQVDKHEVADILFFVNVVSSECRFDSLDIRRCDGSCGSAGAKHDGGRCLR